MLAAAAVAAAASARYRESWSISPSTAGTKDHPRPLTSLATALDVTASPRGQRPDLTTDLDLTFAGVHQGSRWFPHCSRRRVLDQGQGACRRALIGQGLVDSLAGLSGNPRSATLCRLALSLYNGPTNHLVLVVSGGPQTRVPGPGRPHNCPLTIPDLPMDASWTNDARGSRLRVHVDDALQHPQQDVDNALVHAEWRLQAAPVRVLVQGRSRSRGIVSTPIFRVRLGISVVRLQLPVRSP